MWAMLASDGFTVVRSRSRVRFLKVNVLRVDGAKTHHAWYPSKERMIDGM